MNRSSHDVERSQHGGHRAKRKRRCDHLRRQVIMKFRITIELRVDSHHLAAEDCTDDRPRDRSDHADDENQLEVMPPDRPMRIPKRLQRGDLIPLQRDDPIQHHVEQKRGDTQKDRRDDHPHPFEIADFVGQEAMRDLIRSTMRSEAAVLFDERIKPPSDVRFHRTGKQVNHHIVERPFHVVRRFERLAAHPQDAEPLVVRHELPILDLIDILRRKGDSDDSQLLLLAVDDCCDFIVQVQLVSFDEPLACKHFVIAPRLDESPLPQEQRTKICRLRILRYRNQSPRDRLRKRRQIQRDINDDS